MSIWQITALTAAGVNAALVWLVVRSDLRSEVHRVFFLWGLSVITWNVGAFFLYWTEDHQAALLWAKILQLGVIFLPVTLCHLFLLISEIPIPKILPRLLYPLHCIFALSLPTNLFIRDVHKLDAGWWSVAGPLFWVFLFSYAFSTTLPMILAFVRARETSPMHRARLRALLFATAGLWIFGTNDLLPIVGFDHYPFTSIDFVPLANTAAVFYGILVGFAALQHQLLDVHVRMSHLVAHFIRVAFLLCIGLALLLSTWLLAPAAFTTFSLLAALAVLLISGITASVLFPRLFGSGGELLERRLLGDQFEYHDQITNFVTSMKWYNDIEALLRDLRGLLRNVVGAQSYQIILLDETSRIFTLFESYPGEPGLLLPEIHRDSAAFRYFKESGTDYLSLTVASSQKPASLGYQAHMQLQQFSARLCFPFFFQNDPFGLLLLGSKRNNEPYTTTDIRLLVALVRNLAVIVNQLRLQTHILQVQELDLLGRMSRGMAHDLNNLLTPVHTFLQLSNEGAGSDVLNEELLPIALRNVGTMRAYIREALFFSQNLRPDFQLGRPDVLLQGAVELVRNRAERRNISIVQNAGSETRIEMDSVLIERLITNLLSNAIDASPDGGQVIVALAPLPRGESPEEWLRVSIDDSGQGIATEDLDRIFTPYFTTKKTGDESRGWGLGLAICRKIVHLHGGTLTIKSRQGRGTTVHVDLPCQQVQVKPSIPSGQS